MNSFKSNCTLPPDGTAFVASPDVRGTFDVVWSCISVLLICTWSILHLNIPVQSTPRTKVQKYVRASFRTCTKIKWMLMNVVAPEWALGKAWSDYRSVASLEASFKPYEWSRSHIYLANMGGFAISFPSSTMADSKATERPTSSHMAEDSTRPSNHTPKDITRQGPPNQPSGICDCTPVSEHTNGNNMYEPGIKRSKSASVRVSAHNQKLPASPVTIASHPSSTTPDHPQDLSILESQVSAKEYVESIKEDETQPFPILTQRDLDRYKRFKPLSVERMQRSVTRQSRHIGEIAWHSDERNCALATTAFETINLKHFPDDWEKRRILISHIDWLYNLRALQGDIWILDASQLLLALKLGIIAELPYVSEDELNDRSKSDVFVKLIAVGQIIWFLIQLVSRLARRIATSQLEIMTLAFAACTVVTYALLLDKPKDVQTTITIPAKRYATAAEMNRLANMGPASYLTNRGRNVCIPNNAIHAEDGSSSGGVVALSAGAAFSVLIFGGFHCLAWNFTFPTPAERVLWQAASIFTAAFVPAFVPASWGIATVVILAWKKFRPPPPREKSPSGARFSASDTGMGVSTTLFVGGVLLFFAARVFIVVEVLRTMAFLPPGAFETTWSSELLHIG